MVRLHVMSRRPLLAHLGLCLALLALAGPLAAGPHPCAARVEARGLGAGEGHCGSGHAVPGDAPELVAPPGGGCCADHGGTQCATACQGASSLTAAAPVLPEPERSEVTSAQGEHPGAPFVSPPQHVPLA